MKTAKTMITVAAAFLLGYSVANVATTSGKKVVAATPAETVTKVEMALPEGMAGKSVSPDKLVYDNDQLHIKYERNNSDSFDLIITPKNGLNVIPEYQLNDSSYYQEAYLVGISKKKVNELAVKYPAAFKDGIKWNQ